MDRGKGTFHLLVAVGHDSGDVRLKRILNRNLFEYDQRIRRRLAHSIVFDSYFPAFCFAHRALCAAAIRARAAGLIVLFFRFGASVDVELTFVAPFLIENFPSARLNGEFLP